MLRLGKGLLNRAIGRMLLAALIILFFLPSRADAGTFDRRRAKADIERQCGFGPRIPGSEAHRQCRDWIYAQLEELGYRAWYQPFGAELALSGESVIAWNIWGLPQTQQFDDDRLSSATEPFIVLSAHWDTRPWADQEPGRERLTFDGANDGAAGVAMLLGIARAIQGTPMADRVVLAFYDAEDAGWNRSADTWVLGSQFAAENPPAWLEDLYLGINLDMVSHKGVELRREEASEEAAPEAMDRLWRIGGDLAPRIFIDESRPAMVDDHLPFIRAGYRYIDLIGLPYAYWHRVGDTPDQCDPVTMNQVAGVVIEFIRQELKRVDVGE